MSTTTAQDVRRFEIGQRVTARSAVDHTFRWTFAVIARTRCFVTLRDLIDGREYRVGVKVSDQAEWAMPFGSYSMAPIVRA